MNEENKLMFCKTFKNADGVQLVRLSEQGEAKIRALHDVESIRILRACMEDAQFLTDKPDKALQIALALFDKRYDNVYISIQKTLDGKTIKGELYSSEHN